ncbi:SVWC domain-containing protein [Caerostris extrusa]|uniref:SVWC domain-containing protein n=1 Tax=Caerostris extrusa TaxID=172846 RepID=A0AAV4SE68_CAEEX|nr:SVWC domain-containing protein [Caerostris extrusa]
MKLLSGLLVLMICWIFAEVDAYVWEGRTDTSSGFCEDNNYKIPVGEDGYDDVACEKIFCRQGYIYGHGCGSVSLEGRPGCQLVAGTGHYPDCCRHHIQCENDEDNETH